MDFDFVKYHGLGNDYIVIDPKKCTVKMTKDNIKLICDRNFGVGSDGILYGPSWTKDNQPALRIFNPDGGEAEKSGNGVRIFSRYLFDEKYIQSKNFKLSTLGGIVEVEYLDEKAMQIKVNMGKAVFISSDIPTNFTSVEAIGQKLQVADETYTVNCVSIGNPHCVILMDEISEQKAKNIGPYIEQHDMFPNNINVQLMKVIDKNNIQIEIWERGAGYTLASGSSSCAAASMAFKLGLTDNLINVHMPGGMIKIEIDEQQSVLMTGPVRSIAKGFFLPDLAEALK